MKKFKILYPLDHMDASKAGKGYRLKDGCEVIMDGSGLFYIMNVSSFYPFVKPLLEVLPKFDVEWSEDG